jgi:hypothetical protein
MPFYSHRPSAYKLSRFNNVDDNRELGTGLENYESNLISNEEEYHLQNGNVTGSAAGRARHDGQRPKPRSQTRAYRIRLGSVMRQHGCDLPSGLVKLLDRLELKTQPAQGEKRGRLRLTWVFERPLHLHEHGGHGVVEAIVSHMVNKRTTCDRRMSGKRGSSLMSKMGIADRPGKAFLKHKCETITFPVVLARGRDGRFLDVGLRMHLTNNVYNPSEVDLALGGSIVVPNGVFAALIEQHRGQRVFAAIHPDREMAMRELKERRELGLGLGSGLDESFPEMGPFAAQLEALSL